MSANGRIAAAAGPFGASVARVWLVALVAIPAAFAWLVLLGALGGAPDAVPQAAPAPVGL